MRRSYQTIGNRQIHVVTDGSGPTLLMLHPLPLWNLELAPLISLLSNRCRVIAPDLAGYGLSDPFDEEDPEGSFWVKDIRRLIDKLGVDDLCIYGCDNSSAFAAALAIDLGPRARGIILDDPFQMTAEEHASFLESGLPSFAPDTTGSHLIRLWDHVRNQSLFRPAHLPSLATRLDRDMADPQTLDLHLRAYLRSGEHYGKAMRRGLTIDMNDLLHKLSCPLLILADPGTSDDRLPATTQSPRKVERDPSVVAEVIASFVGDSSTSEAEDSSIQAIPTDKPGTFARCFIPVNGGHLHALVNFEGKGRPLLVMHDPAGSSALVRSFTHPMIGDRPVIAIDMPGNGESDKIIDHSNVSSADYAEVVLEALVSLGISEVDVIGRYSGGPVGMEMSFQRPDVVKHLIQAATAIYDPADVEDILVHYTPDMTPRVDGSHLNLAWLNMKNQALFWPWFRQTREGIVWGEPQIDPALIHQRVFDLLQTGNMYQKAYKAMWVYPMEEKLPQLKVPTLLCAPQWDPIFDQMADLKSIAPQCATATLPDQFADWRIVFEEFLQGTH